MYSSNAAALGAVVYYVCVRYMTWCDGNHDYSVVCGYDVLLPLPTGAARRPADSETTTGLTRAHEGARTRLGTTRRFVLPNRLLVSAEGSIPTLIFTV